MITVGMVVVVMVTTVLGGEQRSLTGVLQRVCYLTLSAALSCSVEKCASYMTSDKSARELARTNIQQIH